MRAVSIEAALIGLMGFPGAHAPPGAHALRGYPLADAPRPVLSAERERGVPTEDRGNQLGSHLVPTLCVGTPCRTLRVQTSPLSWDRKVPTEDRGKQDIIKKQGQDNQMGRSRYKFFADDHHPYFITATTVNWLPLFRDPKVALILLNSLRYLVENQRIVLFAYVIMENHLHLIATADNLSTEIANFKSFTARKCIDYYLEQNNQFILDQLAYYKLKHKIDRTHQLWQEGSHPQRIETDTVMDQKIGYIHHNPVRRGYVDLPEHWRYSSARNYAGMDGLVPVTMEW